MKFILVAIMAVLLSGCIIWNSGGELSQALYWKADGTNYGYDKDDNPQSGDEAVCFGTYVACQDKFTQQVLPVEPPVSPIDPNSNLAAPLDSLPGQ
ncbi:MAG TPA: hypothetical protein VD810_04370 [Methylophilaceae bacterium]|nr:hypothetical protein [Methylophilaceae bacterium]